MCSDSFNFYWFGTIFHLYPKKKKTLCLQVLTSIKCVQVQSYKFIPLVYQIASRMGSLKDSQGSHNFQVQIEVVLWFLSKLGFTLIIIFGCAVCFSFSREENGNWPSVPHSISGNQGLLYWLLEKNHMHVLLIK